MGVADILSDIGKGTAAVGRATVPVLERTAQVLSGEAPQIDQEERQRQYDLEDAEIHAKATALQNQLGMGQKYGTLTQQQQQQYVDAISGLYSAPRHAGTLMEKLRQAIHPNGAVYGQEAPLSSLQNATPQGGTLEKDVEAFMDRKGKRPIPGVKPFKGPDGKYYQPMFDPSGQVANEEVPGYTPPPVGTGRSPQLTGDKIPSDAVGPDGEPIAAADRNVGKSFIEYHGSWWAVAPQKPVFKKVKGHAVLVNATTGAVLRDLGPTEGTKLTTRQSLQPGDDGQMHLVNLTTVMTPEGGEIEVEPETTANPIAEPGQPPTQSPKKSVAGILGGGKTTPAKPVQPSNVGGTAGGTAGRIVPGLTTLAKSKDPLFKSDVAQYTKASEDAQGKQKMYEQAVGLLNDPTRVTDLELIFSWVRSNVQGAGRMTNTEINQAAQAGSLPLRVKSAIERASTGRLDPAIEQQFLADIKRSYDTSQKMADDLRGRLKGNAAPVSTQDEFIYARDPQGNLHRAKKGTKLLEGWKLTNAPSQ